MKAPRDRQTSTDDQVSQGSPALPGATGTPGATGEAGEDHPASAAASDTPATDADVASALGSLGTILSLRVPELANTRSAEGETFSEKITRMSHQFRGTNFRLDALRAEARTALVGTDLFATRWASEGQVSVAYYPRSNTYGVWIGGSKCSRFAANLMLVAQHYVAVEHTARKRLADAGQSAKLNQ